MKQAGYLAAAVAIVAFVAVPLLGSGDEAVWEPYRSHAGAYTVDMPSTPVEHQQPVMVDGQQIPVHVALAEFPYGAYSVAATELPYATSDVMPILEGARDGALGNVGAQLIEEREIVHDGVQGLEIEGRMNHRGVDSRIRNRLFVHDGRLYQIGFVGLATRASHSDVATFFESLRFTTP